MKRIAVLRGDGIGPEVIAAALERIGLDGELIEIEASAARYLRTGQTLTSDDFEVISRCDALLFGAIGDPRVPDGVLEQGILLELRRRLDLYVNVRPFPELDLVIVRENSEGAYSGEGARTGDSARQVSVDTLPGVRRCARYAFELAARRKELLTWVHKTNVLSYSGELWREAVTSVAAEYPSVEVRYEHADAAAYHLVVDRGRFDVILTDNLFGDVLSDLAAGLGDGLGSAASANIHPDVATRPTRCIGLFEPIHGSAPDIAGTGRADPTGAIRAARMLEETLNASTTSTEKVGLVKEDAL